MAIYDNVVRVSKNYLGFASKLFVSRVLAKIGKTPENFTKADIPKFASEIPTSSGDSLSPEKKQAFKKEVLALA